MNLKVEKLSAHEDAKWFKCFLNGGWKDSILQNFPEIKYADIAVNDIAVILEKQMQLMGLKVDENIIKVQEWWETEGDKDFKELVNVFDLDESLLKHKEIIWRVGQCPICPRDIEAWSFVMPATYWKWSAINTMLHEITHFLWFEKIKQIENITYFNQQSDGLDYMPYWYLSEIVIDPILNSTVFAKKYEMTWKSYPEFYEINIGEDNLMQTIKDMWETKKDFIDFYQKASCFINKNYNEINDKYMQFYDNSKTNDSIEK